MEKAPVTAATGALGPVIAKLAALMGSECKLRWRTRRDIKFIKSKLKSVYSLLWTICERQLLDATSKELEMEALDLADDMEDAIDDFIVRMERSRSSKRFVQTKVRASPLQDFKKRVTAVSGRCSGMWKKKISSSPSRPTSRARPFVRKEASELVPMDRQMDVLIGVLVETEDSILVEPQLKMASILGTAGMGKTTLADLIYQAIGNKFQARAFVSVTPGGNITEVLARILQEVADENTAPFPGTEATTEQDHLIDKISYFLRDRRYLVIIDDIWDWGEWEIIKKSLPENNLGSTIITTTRVNSIAEKWRCYSKTRLHEMDLQYQGKIWEYDIDVDVGSRMIAMKAEMDGEGFDYEHPAVCMCGGVPLPLVCMFSAVAMEVEQQQQKGKCVDLSDVLDTIAEQVSHRGIHNIPGFEPLVESLQLGYDNLPNQMLKTCLMYCSIYPEDYCFKRDDCVREWMAQGFVCREEAARGYFEELADRRLIMGTDEEAVYRMHPMMRNFLGLKSSEDNFITFSSNIFLSSYAYRIRRLSVDYWPSLDGDNTLQGIDWSSIRSLVVFEDTNNVPLEKLKLLRVLDLQCKQTLEEDRLMDVSGLLHLRHLLGLCGVPQEIACLKHLETLEFSTLEVERLPDEVWHLQNLKTLDVRSTGITELPSEVGKLQNLETLDISSTSITELPSEVWHLQNLKTLDVSSTGITELPSEIGQLQQLKSLFLAGIELTKLPSEIRKLQHLETLDLSRTDIAEMPRGIGELRSLERLLMNRSLVRKVPKEVRRLKKLKILQPGLATLTLPWELGQLTELARLPECARQAWKKSDLVSLLAGEILSFPMAGSIWDRAFQEGLTVESIHAYVPIKDHMNYLTYLDIRICMLEEEGLRILQEMPNLFILHLRFEVVPREPVAISGGGFRSLKVFYVHSRMPRVTFQEGAMPMLLSLSFIFGFYAGPTNKDPVGIKHLANIDSISFKCNDWYLEDSPCIIAMIEAVAKEAREHPSFIDCTPNHFLD